MFAVTGRRQTSEGAALVQSSRSAAFIKNRGGSNLPCHPLQTIPHFGTGAQLKPVRLPTQMSDPLSRTAMFALAARYERLGNRIEAGDNIFNGAGSMDVKSRL